MTVFTALVASLIEKAFAAASRRALEEIAFVAVLVAEVGAEDVARP